MINFPVNSTDFRLLQPETIWLESEQFDRAREISDRVRNEAHLTWQTYLNALALLGFEQWLRERIPDKPINLDMKRIETACYLNVGEFKVGAIATEHALDELVNVPQAVIERPELAAHFYVVLEVDEEQQQVIIRGVLRYDQLVNYQNQFPLQLTRDGYYQLPLPLFDAESNHLLFYCRFLQPAAIPLPVAEQKERTHLQETRTKLSQWLQGVFAEGWQVIDALITPEVNLALSTRNAELGTKRCKLIDLGMQLGSHTVALLVTVCQETEEKLGISMQLHPTGEDRYLPPNLKLTLLSKAGKILQEVTSRGQDNYIQLKSFRGEPGKRFSIEVSLGDVRIREDFEF